MNFAWVDVCFYCEKEVIESNPNYYCCCMWSEWFYYTGFDNFSCKDFKKKVANFKKKCNPKNTIKRKDIEYDKPDYGFDLFLENSILLK